MRRARPNPNSGSEDRAQALDRPDPRGQHRISSGSDPPLFTTDARRTASIRSSKSASTTRRSPPRGNGNPCFTSRSLTTTSISATPPMETPASSSRTGMRTGTASAPQGADGAFAWTTNGSTTGPRSNLRRIVISQSGILRAELQNVPSSDSMSSRAASTGTMPSASMAEPSHAVIARSHSRRS